MHKYSCEPIPEEYEQCRTLPGRGSTYYYPQFLPNLGGVLEGLTVDISFLILTQFDPQPPPECNDFARHVLCFVAVPPCEPETGLPLVVCNESCAAYKKLQSLDFCRVLDQHIRAVQNASTLRDFSVLVEKYFQLDCEDTSTYIFDPNITEFSSSTCAPLFEPNTLGKLSQ